MVAIDIDRRFVIIGILVVVILAPAIFWSMQARGVKPEFVQALRENKVTGLPINLQGKTWSEAELASVYVRKVPRGAGQEQSIPRAIHTRGDYTLSSSRYTYQGTINDGATGVKHVFGRLRRQPGTWRYEGIHPDSAEKHIQRRQQQLDAIKRQQEAVGPSSP
jgi:hypothetical protein